MKVKLQQRRDWIKTGWKELAWIKDVYCVFCAGGSEEGDVRIKDETPASVRAVTYIFSSALDLFCTILPLLKLNAHHSVICFMHPRCSAERQSGAQHLSLVCSQSRNSPRCRHANPCRLHQWEDVHFLWTVSDWLSFFKSVIVKCKDRLTFNLVSAGKFRLQAGYKCVCVRLFMENK